MEVKQSSSGVLAIVLNYNGGDFVLESIQSLLQGKTSPRILVVDNASTDGSWEKIHTTFPDLFFLRSETNRGFAGGMNMGLQWGFARGYEFFWLFNNDAHASEGALAVLLDIARQWPRTLLSPQIMKNSEEVWFSGGRISFFRMRTEHIQKDGTLLQPYETEYLTGCALFLPREAVREVGLLDEDFFLYYEDADYSLRAAQRGYRLMVVPEARVTHAESSAARPEKIYWLVRSGIHFFRKWCQGGCAEWITFYLFLRRIKNQMELWMNPTEETKLVAKAYRDEV